MGLGGGEILIVIALALLLFGAKNLPKMSKEAGKAARELKTGLRNPVKEFKETLSPEDAPKDKQM